LALADHFKTDVNGTPFALCFRGPQLDSQLNSVALHHPRLAFDVGCFVVRAKGRCHPSQLATSWCEEHYAWTQPARTIHFLPAFGLD
jgi:hypothetical protein